uniref:EF-hand domain-containing protein n=1 Tax=Pyrodinium bahamense TaxID=73915 RepID=A0A7S0B162_9DINO
MAGSAHGSGGMGAAPPSVPPPAAAASPQAAPDSSPTLLKTSRSVPEHKVVHAAHLRCKCGNTFMPDAEFCRVCGATRPPISQGFCYCGNLFQQDEVFCRKCGASSEAMILLVKLKTAALERLKWSREDDPSSFEAWNVNAKLESEFAYMHSLLCNRKFVEVVWQEFRDFDGDGDGSLDQQEVAEAVLKMVVKHGWKTKAEVENIDHGELTQDFFRQMDRDSDARVSMDEFLVYTAHFHYLCYQHRVAAPEIFFYEGKKKKKQQALVKEVSKSEAASRWKSCCC